MSHTDYMEQFKKVDKETYKKFLKDYGVDKWEQNFFMDWLDTYDFSLASGKYEKGTAERLDECIIARKYCDCGEVEYYIKKTILHNHNKIMGSTIKEVYIDEAIYETKNKK